MAELNLEHVLILAVAVFLLYHFVGRCNCFNGNGFNVGGLMCLDQWGSTFEGKCGIKEGPYGLAPPGKNCQMNDDCNGCRYCDSESYGAWGNCQGESKCPT